MEDCGAQISEYSLEKVEYSSANMLLCCDVSGSMQGHPFEDSRAAVISMAESMSGNARLGVILFNSSVQGLTDFTVQPDVIRSTAESMTANGGTNIFDTVVHGLESFPKNGPEVLNTLVVMSDGQENNSHSAEEIQTAIGQAAKDKSILVHCLGLGSEVDANYLQTIAQSTRRHLPVCDGLLLSRRVLPEPGQPAELYIQIAVPRNGHPVRGPGAEGQSE